MQGGNGLILICLGIGQLDLTKRPVLNSLSSSRQPTCKRMRVRSAYGVHTYDGICKHDGFETGFVNRCMVLDMSMLKRVEAA